MTLVISIAGSDPGRGAGLQMDERVCRRIGVDFSGVMALDTVQDLGGLHEVRVQSAEVAARFLREKLQAFFAQNLPSNDTPDGAPIGLAVKTGALGNAEIVCAIAEVLRDFPNVPLVVDPVFAATKSVGNSSALLTPDGWVSMQEELFAIATLVTPNTQEYGDSSAYSKCSAVLLKGGHSECEHANSNNEGKQRLVIDTFLQQAKKPITLRAKRLQGGTDIHGTGCALSAAIASYLAKGADLEGAVQNAHSQIHQWIADAVHSKQQQSLPTSDLLCNGIWQPL